MSRRHCQFACEGETCVGTLDDAPGTTGLLIVTGGNEVRAGAWNGQARLAARLAAAGFPVFRYDRRGIGDSTGANHGFRSAAPDIAAALAAFRSEAPQLSRIVAFGNCDGATALVLATGGGCDELVLSNPWTIEADGEAAPPPEALRAHYAQRLRDPAALLRLLSGRISPRALVISLRDMLRPIRRSGLAHEFATGLSRFPGPVTILVAGRDRTAQVFLARWNRKDPRLRHCPQASHSYVEPEAWAWLESRLIEALKN